jgi:hypothetical protein
VCAACQVEVSALQRSKACLPDGVLAPWTFPGQLASGFRGCGAPPKPHTTPSADPPLLPAHSTPMASAGPSTQLTTRAAPIAQGAQPPALDPYEQDGDHTGVLTPRVRISSIPDTTLSKTANSSDLRSDPARLLIPLERLLARCYVQLPPLFIEVVPEDYRSV